MGSKTRTAIDKLTQHKLEQSSRPILSNEPVSRKEFNELKDLLRDALREIEESLNRLERKN